MKKIVNKRNVLILLVLLLVTALVWWFIVRKPGQKASSHTSAPVAINSNPIGSSTPTVATPNPNVPGGSPGNGIADGELQAPSGTFVSNHQASLDASDNRNNEQSICNTNIGASCEIIFTNGSVTKSLGALTAVSSKGSQTGSVSWPIWSPASLGLSAGTWKITATASLNGQTKSTIDSISLEVSQ